MKIIANAKINLCLDVVGKRKDGYHDLDMIMVPLALHDTLEVTLADSDTFSCDNTAVVFNASNTICKAIQLMREAYGIKVGFHVTLVKRIPMQAGLAGGSADGAAMLKAINQLCDLQLDLDELIKIGVKIGADVPFCLVNQISRVQGIGDKIYPLHIEYKEWVLLVKAKQGVATKEAFSRLDFATCEHPDIEATTALLLQGDRQALHLLGNTLEATAFLLNTEIQQVKADMGIYGFDCVLMSGSGACVFAISNDRAMMQQAQEELSRKYAFVELTTTI